MKRLFLLLLVLVAIISVQAMKLPFALRLLKGIKSGGDDDCHGTPCAGGCCPNAGWYCCEGDEYCAISIEYC